MAGELELTERCSNIRWVDDDDREHPLPDWARWFIAVGQATADNAPDPTHRQWLVVTLPDRRFAAALCAHGITCALARSTNILDVESRFADSIPGDSYLTWLDANGQTRFGRYLGIERGLIHYQRRDHGGWGPSARRTIDMATSFWPASGDTESVGAHDPAEHSGFALAATGCSAEQFLARSDIDTVIVGIRTEIENELTSDTFACSGERGTLIDTVRPRELVGHGQHYRSTVLSSASRPDQTEGSTCHGPAIFDGPGAYLRHRDSVSAHTCIVILDRWQPASAEAASTARIERNETWIEAPVPHLPPVPPGIEVYQWTEEL